MGRSFVAKRFSGGGEKLSLDTDALSRFDDVIDLSIGDTDIVTDSAIIEKAFADAKAGYTRYGNPKGDPELIDAVLRAWEEDFGEKLTEDRLIITPSSVFGMAAALSAVTDPGDEVLVLAPYFTPYRTQAEFAGAVVKEVPLYPEEGYRISEERLEEYITDKTKIIIFNNPVNPTGASYNASEMMALRNVAVRHDLLVVADEIYTFYMYDGEYTPIRMLPGMAERTVTLNSFSKNFLMTGWRLGYIIAEPDIIEAIGSVCDFWIYTSPSISQRAAIKALEIRREVEKKYIPIYRDRVMYSADRISKIPYMDLVRPGGTFYLFPSVKRTGLSSKEFTDLLFEKCHVTAVGGHLFGACGEGSFRIACTVPMEKLAEAFDRMEKLGEELKYS